MSEPKEVKLDLKLEKAKGLARKLHECQEAARDAQRDLTALSITISKEFGFTEIDPGSTSPLGSTISDSFKVKSKLRDFIYTREFEGPVAKPAPRQDLNL